MLDHDEIEKLQNPDDLQSSALLPLNPELPYLHDNSALSNLNQRSTTSSFFCGSFYGMERGACGLVLQNDFYYAKKKRFDSNDQRIVWGEVGFTVPKRISLSPIKTILADPRRINYNVTK